MYIINERGLQSNPVQLDALQKLRIPLTKRPD